MGQIDQAERQDLPIVEGNQKSCVQVLDREQSPCVQPSMLSTTTTAPSTMRRASSPSDPLEIPHLCTASDRHKFVHAANAAVTMCRKKHHHVDVEKFNCDSHLSSSHPESDHGWRGRTSTTQYHTSSTQALESTASKASHEMRVENSETQVAEHAYGACHNAMPPKIAAFQWTRSIMSCRREASRSRVGQDNDDNAHDDQVQVCNGSSDPPCEYPVKSGWRVIRPNPVPGGVPTLARFTTPATTVRNSSVERNCEERLTIPRKHCSTVTATNPSGRVRRAIAGARVESQVWNRALDTSLMLPR